MTIPLFISESVPKEIGNILKSLELGMTARYKGETGTIEFVDDSYITLCISMKPNNDPNSRKQFTKCCICIYPHQWDDLEIEDSHFYDHKAFRGKTNDHPGNDMLPPINER